MHPVSQYMLKKIVRNLLLLFGSILFSLAIVELSLRAWTSLIRISINPTSGEDTASDLTQRGFLVPKGAPT